MRSSFVQTILASFIALYMILLRRTTRWEYKGLDNIKPLRDAHSGMVLCYWHSRIMMAHSFWDLNDPQIAHMMISLSRDGGFVARATEMIGRKVIRGSSSKRKGDVIDNKGALAAVREMISAAKTGNVAVLTPDGPKGPRMRFQPGAVRIAKSAKAPMIPIALCIKGSRYLKTWDRFALPPLFSKGVVMYGAPVYVEGNDEIAYEEARQKIEDSLINLQNEADNSLSEEIFAPGDAIIINQTEDAS